MSHLSRSGRAACPWTASRTSRDIVDLAFQLALKGDYARAMKLNGLCYASALGVDQVMHRGAGSKGAVGAGLTGTGPATAMLVDEGQGSRNCYRTMSGTKDFIHSRHIQRIRRERMKLRVRPSAIEGTVAASPSKSYTHRAMVLACLADGHLASGRPLLSGDTLATLNGGQEVRGGDGPRREALRHRRRRAHAARTTSSTPTTPAPPSGSWPASPPCSPAITVSPAMSP